MRFASFAVAVFIAAAAIDYVEAFYVRAVADGRAHRAALYSVLMYVIGCVGFFAVLEVSWWLMVPECAGLWVGSELAVRRQNQGQLPRAVARDRSRTCTCDRA
jgi:inner membrane protein involved in colicin E2 resistance